MRDPAIGLGLGLALLLIAPRAGAQATPSLELAWSAPAGCPDHDAVVARVERWLTRSLDVAPRGALSIAARVTPGPPWHLEMAIVGHEGSTTRSLDDASCERLADATALIITLPLDPDADDPDVVDVAPVATIAPRAPVAPMVHPVDAERVVDAVARPSARRSSPAAFALGAAIAFNPGTLPGLGVGAEARVGLAFGRIRLALRAVTSGRRARRPRSMA